MMKLTLIRTLSAGSLALGLTATPLLAGTRPPAEHPAPVAERTGTPQLPAKAMGEEGTTKKAGDPLGHQDVQFLQQICEHQMGNLVLGLMMIERADSDELRKHGHALVDEAVKANKALMELAGEKDIFIAVDQIKLPTEELTTLSEKAGKEFDSAVILSLLNNGTKVQSQLQGFLGNLKDPQVREAAQQMISGLGQALTQARSLANALGLKAPMPVGEPPLPEKEKDSVPKPTPQNLPPKGSGDGEEGGAIRPFDNPPGF